MNIFSSWNVDWLMSSRKEEEPFFTHCFGNEISFYINTFIHCSGLRGNTEAQRSTLDWIWSKQKWCLCTCTYEWCGVRADRRYCTHHQLALAWTEAPKPPVLYSIGKLNMCLTTPLGGASPSRIWLPESGGKRGAREWSVWSQQCLQWLLREKLSE